MRSNRETAERWGHLGRPQVLVCILLVGFFVYNPFIALIHSSAGLSVDRLPRNRATVGTSELKHFSPVENAWAIAISAGNTIGNILPVLRKKEFLEATASSRVSVALCDFSSNLWFRPPPTV